MLSVCNFVSRMAVFGRWCLNINGGVADMSGDQPNEASTET